MAELAWLIPALPLLAAAVIGVGYLAGSNRGEAGERLTAGLAPASARVSAPVHFE